ncbi:MAG: hypothetical protein AUK55_13580 [Syntrophobacteraceae bacterium CG2_30_61_12]|nr:MAG: hypothetical protein AUK55_13580 [Syntrophobacteraceae bacterium CG2_30_61_12]PIU32509.1 MAG: glucose-1-phosphate thymidylyltransferase [Syntrophobacteraceae bacterium CG07_land_8_20_14_0_80_61_8]
MTSHLFDPANLFDLSDCRHRDLFVDSGAVWRVLSRLPSYLHQVMQPNLPESIPIQRPLPETLVLWRGRAYRDGFEILGGDVGKGTFRIKIGGELTTEATVLFAGCVLWDPLIELGPGSVMEPGALVKGPTLIGCFTEVRQGAYVRGNCLVGDHCVVGHTTEIKSSIMLDHAKAGHFAYIGDSILGRNTNLGAGTKLANLKITGTTVTIKLHGDKVETDLRKLGAILGDNTELGCNSVTNPGVVLGKNCQVVPLTSVRAGYYPDGSRVQ